MCAIFGLIDYEHRLTTRAKEKILKVLSRECEIRGTDATGFAYNSGGHISIYKRPLPARKMHLHLPDDASVIMGHTRMATQGSEKLNYNNHPFSGRVSNCSFALAHNGVLTNDKLLRKEKLIPESVIQTDSYIAVQLIEQAGELSFNSIKIMAEALAGSFVFTILDNLNNVYFVRGNNPLTIYNFHTHGFYLYASTKEILDRTLRKLGMSHAITTEVKSTTGDILRISAYGDVERSEFAFYDDFAFFYTPKVTNLQEDFYLEQLKEFAGCYGVDAHYIDLLYQNGFSVDEIEELLYEPDELASYVDVLAYEGYF